MRLVGLIGTHEFRQQILQNREALKLAHAYTPTAQANAGADENTVLLRAILGAWIRFVGIWRVVKRG